MQTHTTLFICVLCFQDFTEEVNIAFEFLLKLTPLLDKADQRCKYGKIDVKNKQTNKPAASFILSDDAKRNEVRTNNESLEKIGNERIK